MNTDLLKIFYKDEHTRESVKQFMINQLEVMAVETVFKKDSVDGICEARKLVDRMFGTLSELYDSPKKPVIESSR